FRDRLRTDPKIAAAYAELKRGLAERHRDDRDAYGEGKTWFIARSMASVTASAAPAPLPARFARLVKIEHTVFALPFAYVGAFLAVGGAPSAHDLLWITLAMIGARSLAMALNRLVDVGIDARNPRTAGRELPSGQLSVLQVGFFCAISLALFLATVSQLAPKTHVLWPIPVAGFVVYPYLKRWT